MKFNKQIAIILVLTSLLLSALGAVYYFYTLNQNIITKNNQLRVVYVASKDIAKHKKIEKGDLKKVQIAKKFLLATPLLNKEIIGKYTKEKIYKNDIFRKEKIINKLSDDINNTIVEPFKYNSYNIAFKMFKNPNYAIKKGDIIDIISV
ncbi:MAG: SAF domain-containing protein, partial [Campylobacterota bacterium]|nr:SAF domain-containing protein [Campylobacterota bacterium]